MIRELKFLVNRRILFVLFAVIFLYLSVTLFRAPNFTLFKPVDFFTLHLAGLLPALFPLLIAGVYLIPSVKKQILNNGLPIKKRLLLNSYFFFLLSFSFVFLPFLFAFYIEPLLGFVDYTVMKSFDTSDSHTFSQLMDYGAITYGVVYSSWVAINTVVYASLSLLLLMKINKALAFSLPFLIYWGAHIITANLSLAVFSPAYSIFPFGITQQPIWTAFIPFVGLIILLITIFLIPISKNSSIAKIQ
ncbi:hypothetical protein LF817_17535 [Halobacillus sp. A1]|uniref:hypothetical protein n=1 Tax=Halobacillus sp. A1 TaxID=2880262 RepID=UPI0020A6B215|nr:hypothetical protein [Halobacillus sp. A1]MCP3033130.1 hypothetical protein [Halobacillus sp. A1]